MNSYPLGTTVHVTIKFRLAGALTDPTAWQVVVKPPNGTTATLVFGSAANLTRISKGHFLYEQDTQRDDPTDVGTWTYWVTSTGVAKASRSGAFGVDPAPF